MNADEAQAVRQVLAIAAEAGLIKRTTVEEVAANTHVFTRKNRLVLKVQQLEKRCIASEKAIGELAGLLKQFGLLQSMVGRLAQDQESLREQLLRDLGMALAEAEQIETDPVRVPEQEELKVRLSDARRADKERS